jgi:hypothetical protein
MFKNHRAEIVFKEEKSTGLFVPGIVVPGEVALLLEMVKRGEPEAVKLIRKFDSSAKEDSQ